MRNEDVEGRLRSHAENFDAQLPRRPDFERRVIARASVQPVPEVRRPAIIRDLALAGLVVVPVSYTHLTLPTICSV